MRLTSRKPAPSSCISCVNLSGSKLLFEFATLTMLGNKLDIFPTVLDALGWTFFDMVFKRRRDGFEVLLCYCET